MELPVPKLTPPLAAAPGRTRRLSAPMLAIVFWIMVLEPLPISVMAMTAATPMMTPRAVRADRILFRCSAPRAVRIVGGSSVRAALCPGFGDVCAKAVRARQEPPAAGQWSRPAGRHAPCRPPYAHRTATLASGRHRAVAVAVAMRASRRSEVTPSRRPWGSRCAPSSSTLCSVSMSSPSIRPSAMRIVRWAKAATFGSCVTRMTVIPSALSS